MTKEIIDLKESCPTAVGHSVPSNLGHIPSNGMFCVKSMNEIVTDPRNTASIPSVFGNFVFEKELVLIGGPSNSGKSIAGMDVILAASTGIHHWGDGFQQEVRCKSLLIDSEMNDRQWGSRYYGVEGIDNIYRATFWTERYYGKEIEDVLDYMERLLSSEDAPQLVVVDNISTISSLVSPTEVLRFVFELKRLKEKYNCTMILISHTNKKQPGKPIGLDDFRGSKVLVNMVDSVVAICPTNEGQDTKCFKLLKSRCCKVPDTVYVVRIDEQPYLHFEYVAEVDEQEVLPQGKKSGPSPIITEFDAEKILEMHKHGLSIREVSNNIGISKSSVGRFLKNQADYEQP